MRFREDLKARVAWGGCSKSCSGDTEVVLVGVVICRFSQAMGNGKPLQNFEIVTPLKFYLKKVLQVVVECGSEAESRCRPGFGMLAVRVRKSS